MGVDNASTARLRRFVACAEARAKAAGAAAKRGDGVAVAACLSALTPATKAPTTAPTTKAPTFGAAHAQGTHTAQAGGRGASGGAIVRTGLAAQRHP